MKQWIMISLLVTISAGLCGLASLAIADDPTDPYQNILRDDLIKTYFLRRIANDVWPGDLAFTDITTDISRATKGKYLQTDNADDLEGLFQTIARRIQLRLI